MYTSKKKKQKRGVERLEIICNEGDKIAGHLVVTKIKCPLSLTGAKGTIGSPDSN